MPTSPTYLNVIIGIFCMFSCYYIIRIYQSNRNLWRYLLPLFLASAHTIIFVTTAILEREINGVLFNPIFYNWWSAVVRAHTVMTITFLMGDLFRILVKGKKNGGANGH
jgi:energy-coupling factor transporter transmembrane protein EcfT